MKHQQAIGFDQKVLLLVEQAADLSAQDKLVFLHNACGDDKALLDNCLSISQHEISDDEFSGLFFQDIKNVEHFCYQQGQVVGHYRIENKIGSGGAADVYLAYGHDKHHGQGVALKVIRKLDSDQQLMKRMEREKKILSQFEHPNIVTFLDDGYAEDGRPYFVLEYVQGKSITEFCKHTPLSLSALLSLFCKVCDAVAYVHARLTLHRDLKPCNILVTEQGVPKLLDFGIATKWGGKLIVIYQSPLLHQ